VHATHFYNVFYPPAESDPGVRPVGAVEAILADPRASVDFIADGVHVHPTAIRAAIAAKTWAGVILITDSNIGAGLPAGVYDTPWGYRVKVAPGKAARHETKNFLAGSALGGVGGIGYMTITYFSQLKTPALFATGLVACLMGFVFVGGVNWLHWRLLHLWHDSMVKKE
jgi:N-acetylglucosamine-6-phosphate deacetylase